MRSRLILNLLVLGTGILLQIIFWETDNALLGVLGYALFIWGVSMIPKTASQKRGKSNKDISNNE